MNSSTGFGKTTAELFAARRSHRACPPGCARALPVGFARNRKPRGTLLAPRGSLLLGGGASDRAYLPERYEVHMLFMRVFCPALNVFMQES
jgi:hypothetical protein